jgi:hypothetical protein
MHRYNNLWPHITDFSNLLQAATKARKGKRYQNNVLAFDADLASHLLQLQTEL